MENDFGKTALHFAAIGNRANAIAFLCSNGADVNKADQDGNTALHRACDWTSKEASKELIKFGADTRKTNNLEAAPLEYAADVKSANFRRSLEDFIDQHPAPDIEKILEYQKRPRAVVDAILPLNACGCSNIFGGIFSCFINLVRGDDSFNSQRDVNGSCIGKRIEKNT